jgi:hypothetical protein
LWHTFQNVTVQNRRGKRKEPGLSHWEEVNKKLTKTALYHTSEDHSLKSNDHEILSTYFRFQASGYSVSGKELQLVTMNILQRFKECMQGTFLPSVVVLVGFVCDLMTYGLVSCTAGLNTERVLTRSLSLLNWLPGCPNDLQQASK